MVQASDQDASQQGGDPATCWTDYIRSHLAWEPTGSPQKALKRFASERRDIWNTPLTPLPSAGPTQVEVKVPIVETLSHPTSFHPYFWISHLSPLCRLQTKPGGAGGTMKPSDHQNVSLIDIIDFRLVYHRATDQTRPDVSSNVKVVVRSKSVLISCFCQ